jgi:hypothetical protein
MSQSKSNVGWAQALSLSQPMTFDVGDQAQVRKDLLAKILGAGGRA